MRNSALLESVLNHNLTTTKEETTVILQGKPVVIFREEYKFTFPVVETEKENASDGIQTRVKRQTEGSIKANDIHAKNIETNKMFAKKVQADVVRARKVNAIVISIGKAFSMRRTTAHGKPDTLVLNKDGPDPTDSAVTIVLEREGEPVSINGHPSDKDDKQKLLSIKNSVVSQSKILNNNGKNIPKFAISKFQRTNTPGMKNPFRPPRMLLPRGHPPLRHPLKQNAPPNLNNVKIFPITNPLQSEERKKQILMEHWRRKLLTYQKRRNDSPFVITKKKFFGAPPPFRGPPPKLVQPFFPMMLQKPMTPFMKPVRHPFQGPMPVPQFRQHNMLNKPQPPIHVAKVKSAHRSKDISDFDSDSDEKLDKDRNISIKKMGRVGPIDKKINVQMNTFEKVRPRFKTDEDDDEYWYDSEEYYYDDDSKDDNEAFVSKKSKSLERTSTQKVHADRRHRSKLDEYSYETEELSEYEYYSDESDDNQSDRREGNIYRDSDKESRKHVKNGGKEQADDYSSGYDYYSDESDTHIQTTKKSFDDIQTIDGEDKVRIHRKESEKNNLTYFTERPDVQKFEFVKRKTQLRSSSENVSDRKIIHATKRPRRKPSTKRKRENSVDDFYVDSEESILAFENKSKIRKNFFTDSAEAWFKSAGELDFSSPLDSKDSEKEVIPKTRMLVRLI